MNVVVVKLGGTEIRSERAAHTLARQLKDSTRAGLSLVLVHGGGDEVTERAAALGIPTVWRNGQRVTSGPMRDVVVEVLGGRVSTRLVSALVHAGLPAIGLSGVSNGLIHAFPIPSSRGFFGYAGIPRVGNGTFLRDLLRQRLLPVVTPLGLDRKGQVYNMNADLAAAALAGALRASLLLLTDVPGVRDAAGWVLPSLSLSEARSLLRQGIATAGMIPKLEAAKSALNHGATSVWIGPGKGWGGKLPKGYGTWIVTSRRNERRSLAVSVFRRPRKKGEGKG